MLLKPLMTMAFVAAASTSVAGMKWEKRVLLVSAPDATNPSLAEQRRSLAQWRAGAEARDLVVVEVLGDRVSGASDKAATLRQRYGLSPNGFTAVLIGKDGGVKLRKTRPLTAAVLEDTIDAMPMRREGKR